jgi:hypothetical protein
MAEIKLHRNIFFQPCLCSAALFFCSVFVYPITLASQTKVVWSNGTISFEEYQPIIYPDLWRIVGRNTDDSCELAIMPGGIFTYSFQNPYADSGDHSFRKAILDAFSGWRFINNTDKVINVKLTVLFELSGTTEYYDSKLKNQITFDQNSITIKVTHTKKKLILSH